MLDPERVPGDLLGDLLDRTTFGGERGTDPNQLTQFQRLIGLDADDLRRTANSRPGFAPAGDGTQGALKV